MIDLDDFKLHNDTYGHSAGDAALITTANIIKKYIRKTDILIRYGGDEFLVVITETTELGARQFCERLRHGVEQTLFQNVQDSIRLTLSLGLTMLEVGENISAKDLVRRADRALYQAKNNGRNQICILHPDSKDIRTINPPSLARKKA